MEIFNFAAFAGYLTNQFLLWGAGVTLGMTVAAAAGGLLLALVLAGMRMSSNVALSQIARFYLWVFRGTPLLIQLVIIYSGMPQLGLRLGVLESALIALILNEAAYMSEIVRSGFMGVAKGQREAADSLGLPSWLVVWKVTLPQAFRLMIPPLGNSINGLLKATSITSVISMEELMRRSQMVMQEHFHVLEVFGVAAIYYLVMTTAWGFIQERLERRFGASTAHAR
ncbi:amino acid ABC transporter permease [Hydrogenophaga laconesensis]|uniref:Polar amino acid transport system permease protein n=1 Tax=Hydrogenophaga laconesensis TaxID=1805971 RepID=A0ABU1VHR1_9BURK|nr:amino acid ABC transporter permease [Hydrogenophaga laconesensis]MDR7097021.1 polar amino acid transport system permease protein [Hydrogenophaga laconesensis]